MSRASQIDTGPSLARWQAAWADLAPGLKRSFLNGSVGAPNLLARAAEAFQATAAPSSEAARKGMFLGRELILAAWEADPLNGVLASQVLLFKARTSGPGQDWIDPGLTGLLAAIKAHSREPADQTYYRRLLGRKDFSRISAYLEEQLKREPHNLYWLSQIRSTAVIHAETAWFAECLDLSLKDNASLAPLYAWLQASLLYAQGDDLDQAGALLRPLTEAFPAWQAPKELSGQILAKAGQIQPAGQCWSEVLARRPWHVNLLLRLYDRLCLPPARAAKPAGRTAVLIYSWNKADDLARCLESLALSRQDWAFVVALNNGSQDHTGAVLETWRERLGSDKMMIESLPVNIGAPAARNWLMSLPRVQETEQAVFIDDDAEAPAGWLASLAQAQECYPRATVYGGRVLDALDPAIIQAVDLHVLPPSDPEDGQEGRPFGLSDLHLQDIDLGQFEYIRPCASVTGCCHMFRTADLLASGDFLLSLSPSQFDDLEHDLRMGVRVFPGRLACYQGFLSVVHHNRTGRASRNAQEQAGNALANMHKLYNLYSRQEMAGLAAQESGWLEADLLAKAEAVLK